MNGSHLLFFYLNCEFAFSLCPCIILFCRRSQAHCWSCSKRLATASRSASRSSAASVYIPCKKVKVSVMCLSVSCSISSRPAHFAIQGSWDFGSQQGRCMFSPSFFPPFTSKFSHTSCPCSILIYRRHRAHYWSCSKRLATESRSFSRSSATSGLFQV